MTMVMTAVIVNNRRVPRSELRERIERAALALFRQQGFDATTVDEIVAAAGVAKGTFFNFFPGKNAVLGTYYEDLDAFMTACLERLDPRTPEESLKRLFRAMERRLRQEGDLARVLFREVMVEPAMARIDTTSGMSDLQRYRAFFQACRESGSISATADPLVAAGVIQNIWSGTVHEWCQTRQRFSLFAVLTKKLHLVFAGLTRAMEVD